MFTQADLWVRTKGFPITQARNGDRIFSDPSLQVLLADNGLPVSVPKILLWHPSGFKLGQEFIPILLNFVNKFRLLRLSS